jgi:FkbM family methyltransferase
LGVKVTRRVALGYKIRHGRRLARHWAHFRTRVRSDRVTFPGLVELHVDPDDDRGKWVRKHRGVTQSSVTGTWIAAAGLLRPDLCLDIGANYGEVSLLVRYQGARRLLLFEPNPAVQPYLSRSVASHVDHGNVKVLPVAVGDVAGRASLTVATGYSGTANLRRPDGGVGCVVDVELTTVDEVLAGEDLTDKRILFKIDVEGFEGHVLAGMEQTLARCEGFVGIVEFDQDYLEEVAPGNAAVTAKRLLDLGTCRRLDGDHHLWPVESVADLPTHSDIVVSSQPGLLDDLKVPVWVRSR